MRIDLKKFLRAQDGYVCSTAQRKFLKKYGRRPKVTVRRLQKLMDRHGFVRVCRAFARAGLTKRSVGSMTMFLEPFHAASREKYPINQDRDSIKFQSKQELRRRALLLRKVPKALMKDFKNA